MCVYIYMCVRVCLCIYIYIYLTTLGEPCASITKFNRFMVYVVMQAVYSKIHVQYMQTGC